MSLLRKEDVILERDEKGEIIPVKIVLETKAQEEIVVKPMLRGEIQKLFADAKNNETTRDQDKEIILKYCVNPSFTDKEVDDLKFYMTNAISSAVLKVSGLTEPNNKDKCAKETKNS